MDNSKGSPSLRPKTGTRMAAQSFIDIRTANSRSPLTLEVPISPQKPASQLRSSKTSSPRQSTGFKIRNVKSATGAIRTPAFFGPLAQANTAPADFISMNLGNISPIQMEYNVSLHGYDVSRRQTADGQSTLQSLNATSDHQIESTHVDADMNDFDLLTVSSVPSTTFEGMEIQDMLNYIAEKDQEGSCHTYLHVTPRYNLESISKLDFYDLVVLDRPGDSTSGYVWASRTAPKESIRILPRTHLYTLSLQGLMIPPESKHDLSSVMKIDTLLRESRQRRSMASKNFFANFKECKYFTAWHLWVRNRRYKKATTALANSTLYSDLPLVSTLKYLRCIVYDYEVNSSIFQWPPPLGVTWSIDYMNAQIERVKNFGFESVTRMKSFIDFIDTQYQILVSDEYIRNLFENHSQIDSKLATEGNEAAGGEDLSLIRFVNKKRVEYTGKVQKFFTLAQVMMQNIIGIQVRKFLMELIMYSRGIQNLNAKSLPTKIGKSWCLPQSSDYDLQIHNLSKQSFLDSFGDIDYSSSYSTIPVGEDDLSIGAYLSLRVCLCRQLQPVLVDANFDPVSAVEQRIRVRCIPVQVDFVEALNRMFNVLGEMLLKLPNISKIEINVIRCKIILPNSFLIDNFSTYESLSSSSRFISVIQQTPSFQSNNGLLLATTCLKLLQDANGLASKCDKLIDIVRGAFESLVSVNADLIAKQADRSLVVPKIKASMENLIVSDDMDNFVTRDRGRLTYLKKAIEILNDVVKTLHAVTDIFSEGGFVTSFRPILAQLGDIYSIQIKKMLDKVPNTFLVRSKQFLDFNRGLESSFDLTDFTLKGLTAALKRIQVFDDCKAPFELENEACVVLHSVLNNLHSLSSDREMLGVEDPNAKLKRQKALISVDRAQKLVLESYDLLFAAVARTRTLLVRQLPQMRDEVMAQKFTLRQRIKSEIAYIKDERFHDSSMSPVTIINELSEHKILFSKLREEVDDNLRTQLLLVDAHDIVGAAVALIQFNQVDHFEDMNSLEDEFTDTFTAWNVALQAKNTLDMLLQSKVSSCDIDNLLVENSKMANILLHLKSTLGKDGPLSLAENMLSKLNPALDLTLMLSADVLKVRHWELIKSQVFRKCSLSIRFGGKNGDVVSIYVSDPLIGTENQNLGNIGRVLVSDLIKRGVSEYNPLIKSITATAIVESSIESTLVAVERVKDSFVVQLSSDWVRHSKLREKLHFELCRVGNIKQLLFIVQLCIKTVLILEHTGRDMSIDIFDLRLEKLRESLLSMERFVMEIGNIQKRWIRSFELVKFCTQSEVSREKAFVFQSCTEDFKKIEMVIQDESLSLVQSCEKVHSSGINVEKIVNQIESVSDDVDSNAQSIIESCPRLSLLSYDKLLQLIKAWLVVPIENAGFISLCLRDMFSGIGDINFGLVYGRLDAMFCLGTNSWDNTEVLKFDDPIPVNIPLEKFVLAFEFQLRNLISTSCDVVMLNRVVSIRSLFSDLPTNRIISNIKDLFSQRLVQLTSQIHENKPNQCFVLMNQVSFGDDLWFSLGRLTATFKMARDDISEEALSLSWRKNLEALLEICKVNINSIRNLVSINRKGLESNTKISARKASALYSSLLSQENYFLQLVYDLIQSHSLQSAREEWLERYQLNFCFDKSLRDRLSPFEIQIGCFVVTYGLEYLGGSVPVVSGREIERSIQKLVSSSFSQRGSCFVSSEEEVLSSYLHGLCGISCADIASALGRPLTTINNAEQSNAVRLFLSQMIFLDAVGCIDFLTITNASLQLLISNLTQMWAAIEKNDDFYILESLKYPLQHKPGNNDIHIMRRKESINLLRAAFKIKDKGRARLFVIGVASETKYDDSLSFEYFTKSIFDIVSVPNIQFSANLGVELISKGYFYGVELERILSLIIKETNEFYLGDKLTAKIFCYSFKTQLLLDSGKVLMTNAHFTGDKMYSTNIQRFLLEIQCFSSCLWANLIRTDLGNVVNRSDFFRQINETLQKASDCVISRAEREAIDKKAGAVKLFIPDTMKSTVNRVSFSLGLTLNHDFEQCCYLLWETISCGKNKVICLSGSSGSGKSSILKTVIECISLKGLEVSYPHVALSYIKVYRQSELIYRVVLNWWKKTKISKQFSLSSTNTDKSLKEPVCNKIYVSSLATEHLIGSFDKRGKWLDGLFARKLRAVRYSSKYPNQQFQLNTMILIGPLGSSIETLFSGSSLSRSHSSVHSSKVGYDRFVLPSSEIMTIPDNVRIIFETSDLSNASPPLLVSIPVIHLHSNDEFCLNRLLVNWTKSIGPWLSKFPPWIPVLKEIRIWFFKKAFINEMIDISKEMFLESKGSINSSLCSFLRLFEELISQCHEKVLSSCKYLNSMDDENIVSSSDDDEIDESRHEEKVFEKEELKKAARMFLDAKQRELLLQRVRCSLIYSAIWGFGGVLNGTEKKSSFNLASYSIFKKYFEDVVEIPISCSVFDLVLNLQEPSLSPSIATGNLVESDVFIKSDISHGRIIFNTPSMLATKAVASLLLMAGSNLMILGPSGIGKSSIVQNLLDYFSKNCPTPSSMRNHIMEHIAPLVRESETSGNGIPAALQSLRKIMTAVKPKSLSSDDIFEYSRAWRSIHESLKDFKGGNSKDHYKRKTISAAVCSMSEFSNSAQCVRFLLEKEYATENKFILETPRNTFGVVFVDDLHICSSAPADEIKSTSSLNKNKADALLYGLLDSNPSFRIKRCKRATRFSSTEFDLEPIPMPTLHRCFLSDPRDVENISGSVDDYLISPLGVITAATGSPHDLLKKKEIIGIAGKFSLLSFSGFSVIELHTALVCGSIGVFENDLLSISEPELLRYQIYELSRMTIDITKRLFRKRTDFVTMKEKALLSVINFNIDSVARFCGALKTVNLNDEIIKKGGLLHIWMHELQRTFLDSLPSSLLKTRCLDLILQQLNKVDVEKWGLSLTWLQNYSRTVSLGEELWIDLGTGSSEPFNTSAVLSGTSSTKSMYFDLKENEVSDDFSEAICSDPNTGVDNIDVISLRSTEIPIMFSKQGISNLLVLLRAMQNMKEFHVFLPSFYGSRVFSLITLASKLLGKSVKAFKCTNNGGSTGSQHVTDDFFPGANNFIAFLKTSILRAAGLEVITSDVEVEESYSYDTSLVSKSYIPTRYSCCGTENIVLLIENAESLTEDERRVLSVLVKGNDVAILFQKFEILGIAEFLRTSISKTTEDDTTFYHNDHIPTNLKFEGYSYHWVKGFLRKIVSDRIRIVLTSDSNCSFFLTAKQAPSVTNTDQNMTSGSHFSLISNSIRRATVDIAESTVSKHTSDMEVDLDDFTKYINDSNKTFMSRGILECSILGSLVKRHFHTIWIDNSPTIDTAASICASSVLLASLESNKNPVSVGLTFQREQLGGTELTSSQASIKFNILPEALNNFVFLDKFGVFGSFRPITPYIDPQSIAYDTKLVNEMCTKALLLLAHVLQQKTPACYCLSMRPAAKLAADAQTADACILTQLIIRESLTSLLPRKAELLKAKDVLEKGLDLLSHKVDALKAETKTNIADLSHCISKFTKSISSDDGLSSIDSAHILIKEELLTLTEGIAMISEDISAYKILIQASEMKISGLISTTKDGIHQFSVEDFIVYSRIFMNSPADFLLKLMRGLLISLGFVPSTKVSILGKLYMNIRSIPDSALARVSSATLCNQDFLQFVEASKFQVITESDRKYLESICEDLLPMTYEEIKFATAMNDQNIAITLVLKQFVLAINLCCQLSSRVKICSYQLDSLVQNKLYAADQKKLKSIEEADFLRSKKLEAAEILKTMESELSWNNLNAENIDNMIDTRDGHHGRFSRPLEYVISELSSIDLILNNLIGDAVVAAAIHSTCGWLPEDVRSDCLNIFRDCVSKTEYSCAQSPFVVGEMLDTLQVRKWTLKGSRDVGVINSLSLVHLSPGFSLVYDPEGISFGPLCDSCPDGLKLCTVMALKFSITQLNKWLLPSVTEGQVAHDESSLYIIVTDLQSGSSEELIDLLSAPGMKVGPDGLVTITLSSSAREEMSICIRRLKLILISSDYPTITNSGFSAPLPSVCMKYLSVIHWHSELYPGFYVEPKPSRTIFNDKSCPGIQMQTNLANSFIERVVPDHTEKSMTVYKSIYAKTMEAYRLENHVVRTLLEWQDSYDKFDESHFIFSLSEPKIRQNRVKLAMFSDENVMAVLISASIHRDLIRGDLLSLISIERDLIAYQSAVVHFFSMTADICRTFSMFVPSSSLPPFSISSRTIISKCLNPYLNELGTKLFSFLPSSLSKARKCLIGIRKFQHFFRIRRRLHMCGEVSNFQLIMSMMPLVTETGVRNGKNLLFFLLRGLNELLVKQISCYLSACVQPGLEWVVKLALFVHAVSITTEYKIDQDEIMALKFLLDNALKDTNSKLYSIGKYAHEDPFEESGLNTKAIVLKVNGRSITLAPSSTKKEIKYESRPLRAPMPSDRVKLHITKLKDSPLFWTIKGYCNIPGLFIASTSNQWKIESVSSLSFPNDPIDIVYDFHKPIVVVPKSSIVKPVPRKGNPFEMEWFGLVGANLQAFLGSTGAEMMGLPTILSNSANRSRTRSADRFLAKKLLMSAPIAKRNDRVGRRPSGQDDKRRRSSFLNKRRESRNKKLFQSQKKKSVVEIQKKLSAVNFEKNRLSVAFLAEEDVDFRRRLSSHVINLSSIEDSGSLKKSSRTGWVVLFDRKGKKKRGKVSMLNAVGNLDLKVGLRQFLDTDETYRNFRNLERHSKTKGIFGGSSDGITDLLQTFLKWKSSLENLRTVDCTNLEACVLIALVETIIPPLLDFDEELDAQEDDSIGLWAQGNELTVLQTMILVAAVAPHCLSDLITLYSTLLSTYISKGGPAVLHSDEVIEEKENDIIKEGYEDENEDGNDKDDNDFNESKRGDETEISDKHGQINISTINSWTNILGCLRDSVVPIVIPKESFDGKPTTTLRNRDYQDWDVSLWYSLSDDRLVEKFVCMRLIRETMSNDSPAKGTVKPINVLLSPETNVSAMVDFSQKSREFGLYQKKSLTMIHFDLGRLSGETESSGKQQNSRLGLLKGHAANHGIIVERLDMTSSYGNAILDSLVVYNPHNSTKNNAQKYKSSPLRMSITAGEKLKKKTATVEPDVFITAFLRYLDETAVTPAFAVYDFNFIWLPRFSIVDIISDTELESKICITTGLTIKEAAGVLFDELEKTMIWLLTNWRVVQNSTVPMGIIECGVISKLVFRSCTCIIAIWKFSMFLGSAQREGIGKAGIWSKCLENINSWQLLRLLYKMNDILNYDWSIFQGRGRRGAHPTVVSLLADSKFIRAVYLVVEVLTGLYQESQYVSGVLMTNEDTILSDAIRVNQTARPPVNARSSSPNSAVSPRRGKVKRFSDEEIATIRALAQMQDIRRFVTHRKIVISERDRLVSSIAMFLAELIVQVCDPPDDFLSFNSTNSNVVDISTEEEIEPPDIWPDNCDIHIGPMNPQEMCVCLLRWALDGRISTREENRALRKKFRRIMWKCRDTIKILLSSISANKMQGK